MRVAALLVALSLSTAALAAPADRSAARSALDTGIAVAANIVPGVSSLYAPRCLPGYVFCKAIFAVMSVIAAADQLALSGGGDLTQTRGILYRGFAGDWYIGTRHVRGEATPEPLPDPPPPPSSGGKWEPPPL
ncbi:MAG TPA: hypothetical protein VKU61_06590 [Candidatus Binatia bacterium]|nr:hypothetical protein [Candidatus Binatia bacterium]